MEVINWRIVSHPLNWITLFFMVFIGGVVVHLLFEHLPTIAANNAAKKAA